MKHLPIQKRTKTTLILLGVLAFVGLLMICGNAAENEARSEEILPGNPERVAFLARLGWEVKPEPLSRQQVLLPRDFPAVLQNYNELQKQQGFNLEDYKGLTVTLYSYEVTNWPEKGLTVIADLYLSGHRVIGGDIHATALDGFMIALR